jgi:hypothetical protein
MYPLPSASHPTAVAGQADVAAVVYNAMCCRLMVSFNTTTGMPSPFATFGNEAARRATPVADVKTNVAEAGTMSMEFTTIGRLLGEAFCFHQHVSASPAVSLIPLSYCCSA